jgi:hypothetical protein
MTLIPDMPPDDDGPGTMLGVVPAPQLTPLGEADIAVRLAAKAVDDELKNLRGQRDDLAARIRDLVAEQSRLARLVRVLNSK